MVSLGPMAESSAAAWAGTLDPSRVSPLRTAPAARQPGARCRRHHLHETVIQAAVPLGRAPARIPKRATCHTACRYFAKNLLEDDCDIRPPQRLFGHKDVAKTMILAHVLDRVPAGAQCLADRLLGEAP